MRFINYFVFVLCFFSFVSFGKVTEFLDVPYAKDYKDFFITFDGMLYLPKFNIDSSLKNKYIISGSKRILKIPVSLLMEYGLNKGALVRVADFTKKNIDQYKIDEYVYVMLFETDRHDPYKSNASLILSDDIKFHSKIEKEIEHRNEMTGFAYAGTSRNIKGFDIELVPVKNLSKKDPLYNVKELKMIDAKETSLFSNRLVIYQEPINDNFGQKFYSILVQSNANSYYRFIQDFLVLTKDQTQLEVYKIFEKIILVRAFYSVADGDSPKEYLVLFSPKSLEIISLGQLDSGPQ